MSLFSEDWQNGSVHLRYRNPVAIKVEITKSKSLSYTKSQLLMLCSGVLLWRILYYMAELPQLPVSFNGGCAWKAEGKIRLLAA
jgi:hypothetical protein